MKDFLNRISGRLRTNLLLIPYGIGLSFALAQASASTGYANDRVSQIHYNLTFLGLNVGKAQIRVSHGDRYHIYGEGEITGLVSAFISGQGSGRASGSFGNGQIRPARYQIDLSRGERRLATEVRFVNNRVSHIKTSAKLSNPKERVPVRDHHKVNVRDPVSALLVSLPSGNRTLGRHACQSTIPIFDGRFRMEASLEYVASEPFSFRFAGDDVPVVHCKGSIRMVAGQRKRTTEWHTIGLEVKYLALEGSSSLLVPASIAFGTPLGSFVATGISITDN